MFYDSVRSLAPASLISEQLKRQEGVLNEKLCWVERFDSKKEPEPETEFMKPETSAAEPQGLINTALLYYVTASLGRKC